MFKTIKAGPIYITFSLAPPASSGALNEVLKYQEVFEERARKIEAQAQAEVKELKTKLDAWISRAGEYGRDLDATRRSYQDALSLIRDLNTALRNLPNVFTQAITLGRGEIERAEAELTRLAELTNRAEIEALAEKARAQDEPPAESVRAEKEPGLKCEPRYFQAIRDGAKTAELRYDDRGYKVGDWWTLREWDGAYTGRRENVQITWVDTYPDALRPGYVMLSFRKR